MLPSAQTIVGLFLIADRDVLIWVAAIMCFLSIALCALFARARRWPELVCLFVVIFVAAMGVAHLFFKHIVEVPFLKAEPISMSTDP